MKNQKNERGITLVALVVTIVVLLILAGITIMYVMQGDSIFNSANKAKEDTHLADVQEVISLSVFEIQASLYTNNVLDADTALKAAIAKAGMTAKDNFTASVSNYHVTASGTVEFKNTEYTVSVDTAQGKLSVVLAGSGSEQ